MCRYLINKMYSLEHAKSIMRVGWPLIVNNLAIMGINLTDTIMAGRYSTEALAAIAAGGAIWTLLFIVGMGTIMALSPITAQQVGGGKPEKVGHYVRQTLWLALFMAVPLFVAGQNSEAVFHLFGLEPDIVLLADDYLSAIVYALPFTFCYLTLRMASEGIAHTRPIMYISVIGMCTNVFFNWVFMYGNLGVPAMGAQGCGIASALNLIIMFTVLLFYVSRHYRYSSLTIFAHFEWPKISSLKEVLALGIPIGITTLAEMGLFSTAALLMGSFGKNTLAAHQIAINYAAFMFMVPFGMSMGMTAVIGNLLGQGKAEAARRAGFTGIFISIIFMSISALTIIVFSSQIIGLYTSDTAVANIAIGLLGMAAAFQLVDGIQVASLGALRGFKDTQWPMAINVFSYWAIGFVIAWYVGVRLNYGPLYIWAGLVGGLLFASIFLTWRFNNMSRHRVHSTVTIVSDNESIRR